MARQELVAELADFEAKVKNIKDPSREAKRHHNVLKMMDYMGTYYDNLKDKSGICGDYLRVDKQDIFRLEDVLRSIRPDCNARSFKEYLKFE